MSSAYVPGAFSKKKLTVEIPDVVPLEEPKEPQPQPQPELQKQLEKVARIPKPVKEAMLEIKPVEVKQSAWGGKKSFVECLKTTSSEPSLKEEPVVIKKSSLPIVYTQKEIKKEEFDTFMQKHDAKLRKLYEKAIYYDKEYFSKLRINGDQGYSTFCKFMFDVV
jgi:hypothetical protein